MNNIIEDLSTITQIPKRFLDKLVNNATQCIGHSVYEALKTKNNLIKVNVGIGIIYIKFNKEHIEYKFIPSAQLENCLSKVILDETDPIINDVEDSLRTKILNTYKEFM